jgi:predicted short-subunit dehydrogenase-like oxidoreductase (DUF2520 family)
MKLGIIGGGRAAWAFGATWLRVGWPVSGVALRETSRSTLPDALAVRRASVSELAATSELLLIAVSDDALHAVAADVPVTSATIFHASGATVSLRDGFALHPLRTLPAVGEPADLRGATLVFEGRHHELAERIADRFAARLLSITAAQKPLYHAAAVFASNYVAASLEIAERLMLRAGVSDVSGELARLADSAIRNWQQQHGLARFTGPAARGDHAVIRAHRDALRDDPQLLQIYELLAELIAGSRLASEE